MLKPISQRIYYSGRVQGVGFRYTVKQIAAGFEVVGGVRNLPDGRVELEVTGNSDEVQAFLDAVSYSQLATHIRSVERADFEPTGHDAGFEIRH